ncbi:MAG TPA: PilZ domain-containing protein [bacterium]|nr:PilZ domain-containing protein [bacterium]
MTDAADTAVYFVSVNHQQYGPIDRATLMLWLQERRISATDWVWVDSAKDWYPVFIVPDLSALVLHLEEKPRTPPVMPPAAEPAAAVAAPEIGTRVFFHDKQVSDEELVKKRQMLRLALDLPVLYSSRAQEFGETSLFDKTALIDISMLGIAFEAKQYVEPGSLVKAVIEFPTSATKFQASAKVIRCSRSPHDPELYQVGCKYSLLPQGERRKLEKFMEYVVRTHQEKHGHH